MSSLIRGGYAVAFLDLDLTSFFFIYYAQTSLQSLACVALYVPRFTCYSATACYNELVGLTDGGKNDGLILYGLSSLSLGIVSSTTSSNDSIEFCSIG